MLPGFCFVFFFFSSFLIFCLVEIVLCGKVPECLKTPLPPNVVRALETLHNFIIFKYNKNNGTDMKEQISN
jgi:hypothetical protein